MVMAYRVGDKIVYPMHGAGIVEAIEEKEILGQTQSYYIMKMPFGDMKVMIPMTNCAEIGIRSVISASEAEQVILDFASYSVDIISNWNKRYRENMDKMKAGDINEIAKVVKCLMFRDKTKGLSTGERKMLSSARQILISELVLSKSATYDEIELIIGSIIADEVENRA